MIKISGLYIHIPFCSIKCPYCDFTSIVEFNPNVYKDYINALKKEFLLYKEKYNFNLQSIYFGGGTPSILEPELIINILEFILKNSNLNEKIEITIEANPNTYRYNQLKLIKEAGINRISIGNQTFNLRLLKSLGRNHQPKDTLKMVEDSIRAGLNNINLDLIYGIEGQSYEDLQQDLKIYTELPLTHISAYMLTAYEDTPLGSMVLDGKYNLPDEETTTKMFKMVDDFFEKKGFYRYELSNWAKPGYECKHNLLYWTDKTFLGIGISAWSYDGEKRFGNTKNLNEYFQYLNENKLPVRYIEKLSKEDKEFEMVMLSLRLKEGMDISLIKNKNILQELVDHRLGYIENNRFVLTQDGLMVINQIVTKLTI